MQLNFNMDSIKYLKLEYMDGGVLTSNKFAFQEKTENEIVAVINEIDAGQIGTPQEVSLDIICSDGIYKTRAKLQKIKTENEYTYFIIENPDTLDYQQNRNYYRVLAEYDCIYTVYTDDGVQSYNAVTYDISTGGVSIIMEENIVSKEESSLAIMMPDGEIRSNLEFARCEVFEDNYKLSFKFTDLSERDAEKLSKICIKEQLN